MARSRAATKAGVSRRQQTGSKRPAPRTGAATEARKKGDIAAKGTRRRGAATRSRPGKTGAPRPVRSAKR